jgi:hypothetical protein
VINGICIIKHYVHVFVIENVISVLFLEIYKCLQGTESLFFHVHMYLINETLDRYNGLIHSLCSGYQFINVAYAISWQHVMQN